MVATGRFRRLISLVECANATETEPNETRVFVETLAARS